MLPDHVDLDECEYDYCGEYATCINTDGSYYCVCDEGYTGDGQYCIRKYVPLFLGERSEEGEGIGEGEGEGGGGRGRGRG